MNNHILIGILTCVLLAAPIIFIIFSGKAKRARRKQLLLDTLDAIARNKQLYITERELWRHRILGIDRVNQKMVHIDMGEKEAVENIVNLQEIYKCEILQRTIGNAQINAILLELSFTDKTKPSLHIPFYEERNDGVFEMKTLAERAAYWKKMLLAQAAG